MVWILFMWDLQRWMLRFHIDLLQGTEATAAAVAMAAVDMGAVATAAVTTVAVWRLRTCEASKRRVPRWEDSDTPTDLASICIHETLNSDSLWMYLLYMEIIIQSNSILRFQRLWWRWWWLPHAKLESQSSTMLSSGHWSSLVSPTLNEVQDMGKTEKTAASPRCFATHLAQTSDYSLSVILFASIVSLIFKLVWVSEANQILPACGNVQLSWFDLKQSSCRERESTTETVAQKALDTEIWLFLAELAFHGFPFLDDHFDHSHL